METRRNKKKIKQSSDFIVVGLLFSVAPIMHYGFVVGLVFYVLIYIFSRFAIIFQRKSRFALIVFSLHVCVSLSNYLL